MTASTPSGTDIRTGTGYAFDNDDPYAVDRHRLLAALLDPLTTGRLTAVGDLAGRSCLDVGAGGGSIAAWLAQRAGPTGRVVATDLNPRHLAADAGYTILQHDLVREPVPAGPWDLITARLILTHLPQRRDILHRLAAELVPGGWLLVEEYDPSAPGLLLHADDPYAVDLLATYQQVFVEQIRPAAGTDPTWCRQVHHHDQRRTGRCGHHRARRSTRGGGPAALLVATNINHLADRFLAAGMTATELDRIRTLMRDPQVVVRGNLLYSVLGRKPTAWQ